LTLGGNPRNADVSLPADCIGQILRLRRADAKMPAVCRFHVGDRQLECAFLSPGKANRDIGEILNISPRTVNKHLEQVFVKLGVENRSAAAGVAVRTLAR